VARWVAAPQTGLLINCHVATVATLLTNFYDTTHGCWVA